MRLRAGVWIILTAAAGLLGERPALGQAVTDAAERGRMALTLNGYLPAAWSERAYARTGRLWGENAFGPDRRRG